MFLKKLRKIFVLSLIYQGLVAQKTIPLNDLSAFKTTKENWGIAGGASSSITENNILNTEAGMGILTCKHPRGKYGIEYDLFTQMEHGDLDLELDFMMGKGSNSGIYLQSRYEIQLMDSWGVKNIKHGDCGGIYERWDDSKPEGLKGYEGTAPRINVAKAPGLWQNIKISFQAPKFDNSGKKISNAKVLSVYLNGVLIHENVELTGPTRGPIANNEVPLAPLRIQGDHGSVAFRNIRYKSYNQQKLSFSELKWGVYKGKFITVADLEKVKPETEGNANFLNWTVSNEENNFGVKYVGKIKVPEAGKYTLTTVHGGNTQMKINNQEAFKDGWLFSASEGRKVTLDLPAGEVPFEMYYWKTDGWLQPLLGLYAESETIRKHPLHLASSAVMGTPIPQIIVSTSSEPTILRSFMDIPENDKNKRITHAVSVGNKEGVHFTYNLDNGSLFQIWKGGFLNTTPMWNDRGDGSSKPMGSLMILGDSPQIMQLNSMESAWQNIDPSYRPRGYELDENGQPTFRYEIYGISISDKISPNPEGKSLEREITTKGSLSNIYIRLATAKKIKKGDDNLFTIGDNEYFIKLNEGTGNIRTINGNQELLVSVGSKVSYSIIW